MALYKFAHTCLISGDHKGHEFEAEVNEEHRNAHEYVETYLGSPKAHYHMFIHKGGNWVAIKEGYDNE